MNGNKGAANSVKKMEVKGVSESSISNVKLSRSEKKEMKKQRKLEAIGNGNAESKKKETFVGTDSKSGSEANVSSDSRLQGCEDLLAEDGDLGTEQLACSRRKRKRKEKSSINEKQSDSVMESKVNVSLESGLKEEANSLMKDTLPERDSNVENVESIGLESGLKESCLNEQPPHSERKRKRKKKRKEDTESVVELRDRKENSSIDGKQIDSHLGSGLEGVQLKEQPADSESKRRRKKELKMAKARQLEKLDQKSVVELGDGQENSLLDEKQCDSHLESGMKGVQLKEQPADSESIRKRKKELKVAKARQLEKLDQNSLGELGDGKENSLIDEKQNDSHLESGLKGVQLKEQPADSESKRKRKEIKMAKARQFEKLDQNSVVELRDGKENSLLDEKQSDSNLETGMKGFQLKEQPADLERKRKRKKELKMEEARQFEKLDQIVELSDGKENSLIDEKQSDSCVDSKLNVSLELGLKEGENSLMKDTLFERYSHIETLGKNSLESGFRGSPLNEQPTDSKRKRKRKREHKMAKAEQFKKLDVKSVIELRDSKENSLIDEKQSNCRVESKASVSLESGLKEGANSDLGTLENISLESGLKGIQLNEQTVQSERKKKRKREKRKKRMLSVLEDKDITSKRNYMDGNEAERNNMCPEPQIIDRKDYRKEDLMSISENSESKNIKKTSLIPDKQSDSPQNASIMETQSLHVDGDLVMPETKVIETLQIGKTMKTYHRKRKKSSDLLGDSLEPVRENSMIQTSINHLEKEHKTGFSENRSDGVLVGHAMPALVLEEAFGNGTGNEAALNGRERKKRKKLKESLCEYPDQKHVEIETKKEELIPSLSNSAVAKDDVAVKAKENTLSRTLYSSLERKCTSYPKKKLLVLDLNGILVDVVQKPGEFQPDTFLSGKGVFKRPFCDDFLHFCFRTFNVGIWSSRINKNVRGLVSFLMRQWRRNLLFCWTRTQCTITKFKTIEDDQKPLVLKELRKLWEKHLPNLPWDKGEYNESNTLLLDDSPYKALRNPANTAIFPYPFQYRDAKDSSLGRRGDIRKYLEGLAASENVQKYVEQNPFGQPAITESDPHWDFYRQITEDQA